MVYNENSQVKDDMTGHHDLVRSSNARTTFIVYPIALLLLLLICLNIQFLGIILLFIMIAGLARFSDYAYHGNHAIRLTIIVLDHFRVSIRGAGIRHLDRDDLVHLVCMLCLVLISCGFHGLFSLLFYAVGVLNLLLIAYWFIEKYARDS